MFLIQKPSSFAALHCAACERAGGRNTKKGCIWDRPGSGKRLPRCEEPPRAPRPGIHLALCDCVTPHTPACDEDARPRKRELRRRPSSSSSSSSTIMGGRMRSVVLWVHAEGGCPAGVEQSSMMNERDEWQRARCLQRSRRHRRQWQWRLRRLSCGPRTVCQP